MKGTYQRLRAAISGRRLRAALFALVGCVAALAGRSGGAEAAPGDSRYAAIVIDMQTGATLHAENADAQRYPASLTKIMTLYLTFDALEQGRLTLDQRLPVSNFARSMSPTKLGLPEGGSLRVEHAILALVTKSANDAAVVLAEAIGGSEPGFADMMTRKARALGMNATVFRNASGLPDPGQVTTARDMARLGAAVFRDHGKYYHYFGRHEFQYGGARLRNHNRLMTRYDGMDGIKTGYIGASGFNLVGSAARDDRRLVSVVMGGRSPLLRDNRMAELLDDSFEKIGVGRRPSTGAGLVAAAPRPSPPPARAASAVASADKPARKPERAAATTARDRRDDIGRMAAAAVRAAPRPASAAWGVQVGAFNTQKASQQALTAAGKKAGRHLASARAVVSPLKTAKGTIYRARFVGLDEQSARSACAALAKAGRQCAPVAPQS